MVSTLIQCSVPVYRVKELISSDLGHELIDSRAERFLCYSKKRVCVQMADGEELLGRAQSRQLLKDTINYILYIHSAVMCVRRNCFH